MKQSRDFEDFYAANYGKIAALVAAVIGDRHEAADIAQEAFARALARWPRVSGYELPEAWVRQVAMRLAIDSTRRLRRTLRALLSGAIECEPPASCDLRWLSSSGKDLGGGGRSSASESEPFRRMPAGPASGLPQPATFAPMAPSLADPGTAEAFTSRMLGE